MPEIIREEDLRGRVILPFLRTIGFDAGDIKLEYLFKIKLIRENVEAGDDRREECEKRGKADILCKSQDGRNLLIIELKALDVKINKEEDKWQGITYARLLPQMAPVVLLTNGKETYFYDTISAREITGNDPEIIELLKGRRIEAGIEIQTRIEALEHFIGINTENLKKFCDEQHQLHHAQLVGPLENNFKFQPDLFLPRKDIIDHVETFLKSDKPFLPILGTAGCGKTNILIDLSKRLLESGHITLFYNASLLPRSFEDAIKTDFDWFFSSSEPLPQRLRKLRAALQGKRKLVILIDAIDEWPYQNSSVELNDFLGKISPFEGEIQIIATCKPIDWARFETINKINSNLSLLAYKIEINEADEKSEKTAQSSNFLMIRPFNEQEILDSFSQYYSYFGFQGTPTPDLLREIAHPFNLKLLSVVYRGKQLPLIFDEKEIIKCFLDYEIDADGSLRSLIKAVADELASAVFNEKAYVSEEQLKDNLGCPRINPLPAKAFSRNLLHKFNDENGRVMIGFYNTSIQNYITAFWTFEVDKIQVAKLGEGLDALLSSTASKNAVAWYARFAPAEFKEVLQKHIYGRAIAFINAYNKIAATLSSPLLNFLAPEGDGSVGLVYSGGIKNGYVEFGFRRVSPNDPEIVKELVFDDNKIMSDYREIAAKWFKVGVHNTLSSSDDFINTDPEEAAITVYIDNLLKLVKIGKFDWYSNDILVMEALYSILSGAYDKHREILPQRDPVDVDPCEGLVPIPISVIEKLIDYKKATSHYWQQLENEKYKQGDYEQNKDIIQFHFDHDELVSIKEKALEHIRLGMERVNGSCFASAENGVFRC